MIKSAYSNPNLEDSEKISIWKCLTIGIDFEGLIDPVNEFSTVLSFDAMAEQLVEEIETTRKDPKALHFAHFERKNDVKKWVNDFCYYDAEAFVVENYPV